MDHQEQHHQHHQKERQHEKKLQKAHEHQEEKSLRSIHPAWFIGIGVALIFLVVLIWTLLN